MVVANTAQKMKFSIKHFFGKCDQIRSLLRIWSHLLKKCFMENFIKPEVFLRSPINSHFCFNLITLQNFVLRT